MKKYMKTFLAAPGIQFDFIDPDNSTVRETLPGNTYEPAVAHLFLKYIKPNDVVLDIGALYGYFACLAAKISKEVIVYAFDPCEDYCKVIENNAKLNNLNNLNAISFALSDSNSEWVFKEKTLIAGTRGKMIETSNNLNLKHDVLNVTPKQHSQLHSTVSLLTWMRASIAHIYTKLTSPPQEKVVKSIRYDDWSLQNNVKASVAKIDVHGAEIVVLRGMKNALLNDIRHLILEVHRLDMLVEGDYGEIIDILQKSGFDIYELINFRNDDKWHLKFLKNSDLKDFIDPTKWSVKNKIEMRMLFATKGELNDN